MKFQAIIAVLAKARDLAEQSGNEELISLTEIALADAHLIAVANSVPDPKKASMTKDQRRRVLEAIEDCDKFIAKEGPRSAELRPANVAQHLEFCRQHKAKLQAMLLA